MSLPTDKLNGPYRVIFDVGSFRADFARACLAAWPDCRVEAFEPLEPKPWLPEQINWHACALGTKTGRIEINQCEFIPSSSLLPMLELHKDAWPYTRQNEPVWIQMHVLADYADLIEGESLLKIDVQGYELEVLRGAGAALDLFSAVVLEVNHEPLYEGAPSMLEIDRFLAEMGFEHGWRCDHLDHPKTGALLQSDELFLR